MQTRHDQPDHDGPASGQNFWRSVEQLRGEPSFQNWLHREFPENASEMNDVFSRRNFLKLMGASVALAGTTACRQPLQKIVPYVRQPEQLIPGRPQFYATAMPLGGYAKGVLVESHEGRPTKIEGNPDHPASLGATDIFAQASILTLYDPDRSKAVLNRDKLSTWTEFRSFLEKFLASQSNDGAGIRILTQTVTSPTTASQLRALQKKFPNARWHQWEPMNRDNVREGARLAFGKLAEPIYHFDKANVVVALDGDFFSDTPGSLRYARDFMSRRRVRDGETKMNRLYAIESVPTLAGSVADHRLALRPSEMERFAWSLLAAFRDSRIAANPKDEWSKWINALARDLQQHRGRTLIYPGEFQSPYVHALTHLLNLSLGNVDTTVSFIESVEARPEIQLDSLRSLIADMRNNKVDLLLIADGNPIYNAPVDVEFGAALTNVKHPISLGLYENETSALCEWHLPSTHYLEAWGDARSFDGSTSLIQPLIAPLYEGKTPNEVLDAFLGDARSAHEILRAYWQNEKADTQFEKWWEKSLHDGVIGSSDAKPVKIDATSDSILQRLARNTEPMEKTKTSSPIEIIFRPDPTIRDGEFANNGWLQELPKPGTQLTWDNPILLSPHTAAQHNLANQSIVALTLRGKTVRAPVWIAPGHADDCLTLTLGYGRERGGTVGTKCGFDFYKLRHANALWSTNDAAIQKTSEEFPIACTQDHQSMEGRDVVRVRAIDSSTRAKPTTQADPDISLFPPHESGANAWGMIIDLTACIGCKACTIACQAENNIPVVGKAQVMRGREMHWIRVDRYFSGDLKGPAIFNQPVPCMQCENAPCELVCPVAATSHSVEGLNEMTYNRCIGTRYCSNNCPYKVRRFNFFQFSDQKTDNWKLMWNPNVTVRSRGVMEKCTYCVQRINAARIESKKKNRPIRDGEVITACQAVCPTEAIVFGNINDPNSKVTQFRKLPFNYSLLAELNARPRTTYLERVLNPNPEMPAMEESV